MCCGIKGINMKASNYNIIFKMDREKSVLFNALTKRYLLVSNRFLDNYQQIINNPMKYCKVAKLQILLNKFKKCGLIIDKDIDELGLLQDSFNNQVNQASYSLLIMTTYACNFNCWYCVQHHDNITLNENVEEKIKKHIVKYLLENNIVDFNLSWFGGEPLLNFKSIDSISTYAKSFCLNHGIEFSCGITTNGSLLTERMIERMIDLDFTDYQITLDGCKENHNKTKFNNTIRNSFDLILNNIKILVEKNWKAQVTLRINYTEKNITPDLPDEIDKVLHSVRGKVAIMFRQVWQIRDNYDLINKVTPLIIRLRNMGYGVVDDFGNFASLSCYVEKKHYLSVFPNGVIDNCNNKPIGKARGYLNDEGDIVWQKVPTERENTIFSLKSDCQTCKYLPICMGPCPALREGVLTSIKCMIKNPDEYFRKEIEQFVTFNLR